jgi:hypothetical protein
MVEIADAYLLTADRTRSLDLMSHAQDVKLVNFHLFQMLLEESATDQNQFAVALKDTQLMDGHVSTVHHTRSEPPITDHAFQQLAQVTRSLVMPHNAIDAEIALTVH